MVTVMNLSTGDTYLFMCTPAEAVVAAFEQSNGNHNTWEYDMGKAVVSKSGLSVACGDFAALTEHNNV